MNKFIGFIRKWAARLDYKLRHHSWLTTNTGHQRLLFPCCSLSEGSAELTIQLFKQLHHQDSSIGLWQDCCGMPLIYAHDQVGAKQAEAAIIKTIQSQAITEIITPCTTCHQHFERMFQRAGVPTKLTFLFDVLPSKQATKAAQTYLVHHPCPARTDQRLRQSFDQTAQQLALPTTSDQQGHPLSCCLSTSATSQAKIKAHQGNRFITYCAHCVQTLRRRLHIQHILELMFDRPFAIKKSNFFTKVMAKRRLKKALSSYYQKRPT